jgi:hypothetical protein
MNFFKIILVVLIISTSITVAQPLAKIYNASRAAYTDKDYKRFLALTKKLDSIRPLHPTYTYNLAAANAINDNPEGALTALTQLVLMNNTIGFETDQDFKSLFEDAGYKQVVELKKSQDKVVISSKPVVTLSEKDLHPEGVTYLSKSKTWLASSVRKRKIVSFDSKTGKCTDWLKDDKTLSVLAMKADAKEEFLWVATAAFEEMERFDKNLNGKSEVLKVDIKTKKVVNAYSVKGSHVFGDLIIAKNGVIYVSDSNHPVIYKIENDEMTEFISLKNEGHNLQGMAFNDNQTKLFIADYLKGIVSINVETKAKNWFTFPDYASPKGIDGLVFYKNTLIGIQNGVVPIRITQFNLNIMQSEITEFKILDHNRPEFNEPALATLVGAKLYFFANSPWKAYGKNGVLDENKVTNPILFSCKLD